MRGLLSCLPGSPQPARARRGSGRLALLIATDALAVAEPSRRAREHRVAAGGVVGVGVEVTGGETVGVDDMVVTCQNDRRLSVAGRWVKNGDRWAVTATHDDRRIRSDQGRCESVGVSLLYRFEDQESH